MLKLKKFVEGGCVVYSFKSRKHKKKINHFILLTSDASDGKTKQIRLNSFTFELLIILFCVFIGLVLGYLIYGGVIYSQVINHSRSQLEQINSLQDEKEILLSENSDLNEKISILSETVNKKVEEEKEKEALNEEMSIPTAFPLTGSAQVEDTTVGKIKERQMVGEFQRINEQGEAELTDAKEQEEEKQPVSEFTASDLSMVVATAKGTVTKADVDVLYGYKIVIDHGNGYESIYLNKSKPKVKEGDFVNLGATLYVLDEDSTLLGYQIIKDDAYINPMDLIEISG